MMTVTAKEGKQNKLSQKNKLTRDPDMPLIWDPDILYGYIYQYYHILNSLRAGFFLSSK